MCPERGAQGQGRKARPDEAAGVPQPYLRERVDFRAAIQIALTKIKPVSVRFQNFLRNFEIRRKLTAG